MRFQSPLRYPGGKARLANFLSSIIEANGLSDCSYFEPFAGGAGAALRLLSDEVVSELNLNDLDPRIYAFWNAVLNESERFADAIISTPVDVSEWHRQRQICQSASTGPTFELGFATFYLNRCNRSGILLGAAPIGGYAQLGKWGIGARFYREELVRRILSLSRYRDRIHISNLDALVFLKSHVPRGRARERTFAYLDPPYVSNGSRLYLNYYIDRDHRNLAKYMQGQRTLKWVASYDDCPFVNDIYASCNISRMVLNYSLQRKQLATELLIAPTYIAVPVSTSPIHSL